MADRALPLLQERVKITLGLADIRGFDYVGEHEPQPLYLKSRYLPDGFPNRDAQLRFDATRGARSVRPVALRSESQRV